MRPTAFTHSLPPPEGGLSFHGRPRLAATRWLCCLVLMALGLSAHAQFHPKLSWTKFAGTTGGAGFSEGAKADARISYPRGLFVDSSNTAHVLDESWLAWFPNQTIRQVSPTGTRMVTMGDTQATSLYVDSSGTIFTPEGTSISSSGAVKTWRAIGLGDEAGIVKDSSGNMFYAGYYDHVIYKRTPAGVETVFAGQVGSLGFVQGTGSAALFQYPQEMAIDSSGNLYVNDQNGKAIRKITPAGVVSLLTGVGANTSTTNNHSSIAWGPVSGVAAGMVYMVTNGTNVYKISASSTTGAITSLSLSSAYSPEFLATDPTGRLYLLDRHPNWTTNTSGLISYRLRRFPTQASNVSSYTAEAAYGTVAGGIESPGYANAAPVKFDSLQGLGMNSAGDMYVADTENCRIRKVTSAGVTTTFAGSNGVTSVDHSTSRTTASFEYPNSVAVSAAGDVYVTDVRAVRRIKATGTTGLVKTLVTPLTIPSGQTYRGIAVSGNPVTAIYVGVNHKVVRLDLTTPDTWTATDYFTLIPIDRRVKSLSLDPSGNLYVGVGGGTTWGTYGAASVIRLDSAGTPTILMSADGAADGLTDIASPPGGYTHGAGNADGIWAFSTGAYIADSDNRTVRVLMAPGGIYYPHNTYWSVETIGSFMGNDAFGFLADVGAQALFHKPVGLVARYVGTNHELYVTDQYNHSVIKGVVAGPVIEVNDASLTSTTSASVSAQVLSQGGALTITSTGVEYGPTADYGSTATTTSSTATGVRVDTGSLTSLNTATASHYRFKVTMSNASIYYSADALLPSAPVITSFDSAVTGATATNMTVSLSMLCESLHGGMSIEIQRSTDNVNFTTLTTVASSTTSYVDTVPLGGGGLTYYYRIRATNGTYSSAWSAVEVVAQPPVAASGSLSGTVTAAVEAELTVVLTMPFTSIYTGVQKEIQRSTDASTYTTLATVPLATVNYTDTAPLTGDPNLRFYYRCRAVVGTFTSGWYNYTANQPVRPTAGVTVSSVQGAVKIVVTGSGQQLVPSDLTHFDIERSPNGTTWTAVGADLAYSADNKTAYDYQAPAGSQQYRIRLMSGTGTWATTWNALPATRSVNHSAGYALPLKAYPGTISMVTFTNLPAGLTMSTSALRSVDGGTADPVTLTTTGGWSHLTDPTAPFGDLEYTVTASGGLTAAGDPYSREWVLTTSLIYPTVTGQNLDGGGTGLTLSQQYFVAGAARITTSALRSTDGGTPVAINLQNTSGWANLSGLRTTWYVDPSPPAGTNVYTLSLDNVYGWTGSVPDVTVVTPSSSGTAPVNISLTSMNVVLHDDVGMNPEIDFNINASTTGTVPGASFLVLIQRSITSSTSGFEVVYSQTGANPNPVFTDATPVVNAPMDIGAAAGRGINYYLRAVVYAYDSTGQLTGTRTSSVSTVFVPAP